MDTNKTDIQIVKASLESLDELLDELSRLFQSYRIFYKKTPDPEGEKTFLRERITYEESVIYLAKSGDKFVGFVQLFPMFSSTRMKRMWLLNDLYVDADYRKSGAGSMLIEKAKELAREHKLRD